MKKIFGLVLGLFASLSSNAVDFENGCKAIDARVTESSSITCRYFGKTMNSSLHRDAEGDVYAAMFVDTPKINEEALVMMQKLAKVMGVVLLPEFVESVKRGGPGVVTGMQYKDQVVIWRNAFENGPINYSGLLISPKEDGKIDQPARCFAAGCIIDENSKWFGPTFDSGEANSKSSSKK